MSVVAFGQGGVETNHEQHPIDQNNSTINRLIIRMKKPDNDEYPRERIHIYLVIFHEWTFFAPAGAQTFNEPPPTDYGAR